MPNNAVNQDINFQPKTQGYSYTTAPKEKQNKPNTILTLIFSVLGFLLLFFIFLAVLNYFKVISLSKIIPTPTPTPAPAVEAKKISGTDIIVYKLTGTFYGYNQEIIKIKFNNKVMSFIWQRNSKIVALDKSGNSSNFFTIFDLENNKNLGKTVEVEYLKDKTENIIENLTLK